MFRRFRLWLAFRIAGEPLVWDGDVRRVNPWQSAVASRERPTLGEVLASLKGHDAKMGVVPYDPNSVRRAREEMFEHEAGQVDYDRVERSIPPGSLEHLGETMLAGQPISAGGEWDEQFGQGIVKVDGTCDHDFPASKGVGGRCKACGQLSPDEPIVTGPAIDFENIESAVAADTGSPFGKTAIASWAEVHKAMEAGHRRMQREALVAAADQLVAQQSRERRSSQEEFGEGIFEHPPELGDPGA